MDRTNKAKNSYELLFKLSARREIMEKSEKVMFRQAIFVRELFGRVLRSFD